MGKRNKVTTRDIALKLGISQSTVSMVLSNKPNVSFTEETIRLVKSTAKEMGYKKSVPKEKQKEKVLADTIIVICPTLSNGYYTTMVDSIIDQARKYDYTVMTIATLRDAENEDRYLDLLAKSKLAGIISLYPSSRIQKMNALSKSVPMISVGDTPASCAFDSVELDSKKPGYIVGKHLLSLGHKYITYISTPIKAKEFGRMHRIEGMKASFADAGVSEENIDVRCQSQNVFDKYPSNYAEYQSAYDLTSKVLESESKSTAFVGNNDMSAYGIMAAISDHGYRIPADYSVVGFDNLHMSSTPQISLTSVDHASIKKGQQAVDMIYNKNTHDEKRERSYVMHLEYEPQLIVRGSTGRCKRQVEE
ncbi:MAG: LacI family DNA-binding transcriptional regulator [Eubacteriales bacterium]|nr:LacI family DNA-binding transcriptional regulator [Eubacteriales bacterium]